jgi:ferredoxin
MGQTYQVRLEPVGVEFEVDEDETILRGAFRQGLMLMHGCKEGQCSACKSFLLDGEVDLDSYSTFALSDFEKDEGWTLLCRAHAMSDLEIELINYDEEVLRSGVALQTQEMCIESLDALTHDIYRLVVSGAGGSGLGRSPFTYKPGQYVDITIPGTDDVRSFSMADLPGGDLEFMIKVYPDGKFSSLLSSGGLAVGDSLEVTGPLSTTTDRFKSDSTPSNRAGVTLMNNQVGYVVAHVMMGKPGVHVEELPSMIRVDGEHKLEFDNAELAEALEWDDFGNDDFEEIMSTHYGRMVVLDDRILFFANPEDAAEYISFDLQALS